MKLTILAIDKVRDASFRASCDDYLKRLKRYAKVSERELKPVKGQLSVAQIQRKEGERLWEARPSGAWTLALDERGSLRDSVSFSSWLLKAMERRGHLCLLIGGANGHDELLRKQADGLIALSPLTLPHELARVVLYEQLYRAMTIHRNEPYHK